MQICIKIHIFHAGQIFIETKFLWHISQTVLYFYRLFRNVFPQHLKLSFTGKHEPTEHADKSGLPGAVRPDKCSNLPLLHRKGHIMQSHFRMAGCRMVEHFGDMHRFHYMCHRFPTFLSLKT